VLLRRFIFRTCRALNGYKNFRRCLKNTVRRRWEPITAEQGYCLWSHLATITNTRRFPGKPNTTGGISDHNAPVIQPTPARCKHTFVPFTVIRTKTATDRFSRFRLSVQRLSRTVEILFELLKTALFSITRFFGPSSPPPGFRIRLTFWVVRARTCNSSVG